MAILVRAKRVHSKACKASKAIEASKASAVALRHNLVVSIHDQVLFRLLQMVSE